MDEKLDGDEELDGRKELNRRLVKAIEQMTSAKLALRTTKCQKAHEKHQALKKKVNRILKQIEISNKILRSKDERNEEQSKSRDKGYETKDHQSGEKG